jgi:hypothetical protein
LAPAQGGSAGVLRAVQESAVESGEGGEMSRQIKACACGCGELFVPEKRSRVYLNRDHFFRGDYQTNLALSASVPKEASEQQAKKGQVKICDCGCGELFSPSTPGQACLNKKHASIKAHSSFLANLTFEQRSEMARKAAAKQTTEQHSENSRKANASRTFEQRREAGVKGAAKHPLEWWRKKGRKGGDASSRKMILEATLSILSAAATQLKEKQDDE